MESVAEFCTESGESLMLRGSLGISVSLFTAEHVVATRVDIAEARCGDFTLSTGSCILGCEKKKIYALCFKRKRVKRKSNM